MQGNGNGHDGYNGKNNGGNGSHSARDRGNIPGNRGGNGRHDAPGQETDLGKADRPKAEILVPGVHATSDGPVHQSNDTFADAVLHALPVNLLYRSDSTVGVVEGMPGCQKFSMVDATDLSLFVDEHTLLVSSERTEKGNIRPLKENCREGQAKLVLARAKRAPAVKELIRLVSYPVYQPGFTLSPAGWMGGTYYDVPPSLADLQPETDREIMSQVLDDLLIDFPFAEDASRQNFIGLLLTPILRPALDGNVPMHLAVAPLERTGKSKLLEEVLGGVILGRPTPALQFTGNDEELDKRITAMLASGETLMHLDNLPEYVKSAILASLLTSDRYMGRILGMSQMRVSLNTLTIAASGNNVRATGELVKRTIPMSLQPESDQPENRTGFTHPHLRSYVRGVRRMVLGVLLGMVERWKNAGMPNGDWPMGGFEDWARVVGGILQVNGYFRWVENVDEWRQGTDSDGEDLRIFVSEWARRFGKTAQVTTDLIKLGQELGLFPNVLQGSSASAIRTSFSRKILAASKNRPVGGFIIRRQTKGSNSSYFLEGDDKDFDEAKAAPPAPVASEMDPDDISGLRFDSS